MNSTILRDLGRCSYPVAFRLQEELSSRLSNRSNSTRKRENVVLLCEHDPVYTYGRRSAKLDTNEEENRLRSLGASTYKSNRGGLITFHGPGQLVCYPIVDLREWKMGSRAFVCELEETLIRTCSHFGVSSSRSGHTGVWVKNNKIAAIGLRVTRGITSHGIALNCNVDLTWFRHIVPCGITDHGVGVTSLTRECDRNISIADVKPKLVASLEEQFNLKLIEEE